MDCRRRRPGRGPGRLHGRDPRGAARREASSASRRSRSSAARACASAASRRRRGCRPRTSCTQRARLVRRSSASRSPSRSSTSRRRTSGRPRVVKQMTGGVASLFKANGVEWVQGQGHLQATRTRSRSRAARTSRSTAAIVATGLVPDPAADPGARLGALRRLDRPARADGGAAAARDPRRRDHRLRVRVDLPARSAAR